MNKKTDEKTIKDLTTEEKAALIEQARANMTPEERETARELAEMIGSFAAWWNSGEIVEQRQAAGEMLRTAMNGAKVAAEIFASLQEFLPALLEEMEKDGTAATMTASEFIESGKFDEIVDRTAERLQGEGVTKEEIREVITESLLSKNYISMYNNKFSNGLIDIHTALFDPDSFNKKATYTAPDGTRYVMEKYGDVKTNLGTSAHKILNTGIVGLTETNYYRANRDYVNNIVEIPLYEYAEKCGVSVTPQIMATPEEQEKENKRADNALKNFKKQIRNDLNGYKNITAEIRILNGKNKGDYIQLGVITKSRIVNGKITIYFDQDFAASVVKGGVMQFPLCLLHYDNRYPNHYNIGYQVALHNSMDNNAAAGTDNTLSVKSLLSYAPEIPAYETLQKRGLRNWKDKIKKPLETSLDYQITGGLWSRWEYRDPKTGDTYDAETSQPMTWAQYSRLMVDYVMVDPPDQTERREKRAEEKAQAAIAASKPKRKPGRPKGSKNKPKEG